MRNERGVMMVIAIIFVLFFAVLTLPLVRNAMSAVRQRVLYDERDEKRFLVKTAHQIALYEIASPDTVGRRAVRWEEGDLTPRLSRASIGWTLQNNKAVLNLGTAANPRVAHITVRGYKR